MRLRRQMLRRSLGADEHVDLRARRGRGRGEHVTQGPFRWIDSYRLNRMPSDSVPWCGSSSAFDPAGGMARDMNLFVDDDGTAYIIYSSEENRTMYISKRNADYTYLSATPDKAVVDSRPPLHGGPRPRPFGALSTDPCGRRPPTTKNNLEQPAPRHVDRLPRPGRCRSTTAPFGSSAVTTSPWRRSSRPESSGRRSVVVAVASGFDFKYLKFLAWLR
jgi:hypothetical protein